MPKERISSTDVTNILKTDKVKCIDCVSEMSHLEIVYEVAGGVSANLKCDFCGAGATYIHHTRDHMGQNFVDLTCVNCAPPGYEKLSQKRGD